MNITSILLLISFLGMLFLANYVLNSNSNKDPKNIALFFYGLIGSYSALCTFLMHESNSFENSIFWANANILWAFVIAISLHLVLLFTNNKNRNNIYVLGLLYAFPVIFLIIQIMSEPTIIFDSASKIWINESKVGNSMERTSIIFWSIIITITTIFLSVRETIREKNKLKHKQMIYVTTATVVPLIMGFLGVITGKFSTITTQELPIIGLIIPMGIFTYAISHFELLKLNPKMFAEKILSAIPNAIIITDYRLHIVKANPVAEVIFENTLKNIIGKNLKIFFYDNKQFKDMIKNIKGTNKIENVELKLQDKNRKEKNLNISVEKIVEKDRTIIGFIFVANDITKIKNNIEESRYLTEQLSLQTSSLEKFNKLAVGRELKMIELKNRLSELKSQVSRN